MTRLALLRHGHTAWNRAGQIQGRSDIPLDDEARATLTGLSLPPPWNRAALWASPLSRAVETAQLVSGHAPTTDPALTEMHWGDWEGKQGVTLHVDPDSGFRHIEEWGWDFTPPNGESPRQVAARLMPWTERLTGDNLAVCHIGTMRVLLAQATGWGFSGPAPFTVKRNRLYVLERSSDGWQYDPAPVRLQEVRP